MNRRSLLAGLFAAPAVGAALAMNERYPATALANPQASSLWESDPAAKMELVIRGSGQIDIDELARQLADSIRDGEAQRLVKALRDA